MINLAYCVYLVLLERLKIKREYQTNYNKKYYKKNSCQIKSDSKKRRKENPVHAKALDKRRYEKDKEKIKGRVKRWGLENPEKVTKYHRKWDRENPEKKKAWNQKNKPNRNAKNLRRYYSEPEYRLLVNYRTRVVRALNGNWKSGKTLVLIGCSVPELRTHLEKQFQPGMTWENYGGKSGWQIDHVKPCAKFDLAVPAQQRECFHFSNLQPLWAKDNRSKSDKYVHASG